MLAVQQIQQARARALDYFRRAGIVITPLEEERIEVADFGLGDLNRTGLELLTYVNTDRYCAKEMVLFPGQTCPEHRHPAGGSQPGKEETFRCRWGKVYLFVEGQASANAAVAPPKGDERYYTAIGAGAGSSAHDSARHAALVSGRQRRRRDLRIFLAKSR